MGKLTTEAKFGLFIILFAILFLVATFKIGDFHLAKGKGMLIYTYFDSAAGIKPESVVRIAGVDVGVVDDISLEAGRAKVAIRLQPGVEVRENAQAFIKTMGLMGEKYLELVPGSPDHLLIEAGGELPYSVSPVGMDEILIQLSAIAKNIEGITRTFDTVVTEEEGKESLQEVIRNLREITNTVNRIVSVNEKAINASIENLSAFSADLRQISRDNREALKETIESFQRVAIALERRIDEITVHLAKLTESASGIVSENQESISKTVENIQEASSELQGTLVSLKRISSKIDEGQGTLGKLINEDEAYYALNDTLTGVRDYLTRAESFKTYINYHAEYLTQQEEVKNYVSLTLRPKQDKYYILGLVDDPFGDTRTKEILVSTSSPPSSQPAETYTREEKTSEKLKFSAQIAKRYYNLVVRGGFIESHGGAGMDMYFLSDTCRLSVDVFDFQKDKNPHVKSSLSVLLFKHINLIAGYDDIFWNEDDTIFESQREPSFFFGGGIQFTDDDIKYLLQSVPVPK